jgi:hypothetical protein
MLVLGANYDGAVRVVTEPGAAVGLAYGANDNRVYCVEATFNTVLTRLSFAETGAVSILKGTLEPCLLDATGRIKPAADVLGAFAVAVVAVNGWLALAKPLTLREAQTAAENHNLKLHLWRCEKPV